MCWGGGGGLFLSYHVEFYLEPCLFPLQSRSSESRLAESELPPLLLLLVLAVAAYGSARKAISPWSSGRRSTPNATTDWAGELYVGAALKWDCENRRATTSMPGHIEAMSHSY